MKHILSIVLGGMIVASSAGLAFAWEGKEMGGMHGMGMERVVATSDGGVVVITGKKMVKYDKNLKVIGQAELSSICEVKQSCARCKGIKGDKPLAHAKDNKDAKAADTAAAEVDHKAHH